MNLALELINSEEWYGRHPRLDHLEQPQWAARFLERWQFGDIAAPSPAQWRQLLGLRSLLRGMISALAAGDAPSEEEVEELDRFLQGPAVHRRVAQAGGTFRLELAPARRDWAWMLSEIASSFAELLVDGERDRVKLCENPECQWAFYDTSKNRRRRWCNPAQCGNVFKVRQFRARQRAARSTP